MSDTTDTADRDSSFGWRVLTTAAGVILGAAIVYLAAVLAGYLEAAPRPLYVVLLPLAVIGGLVVARYVTRARRPEAFYVASVAGAVAAIVATAAATWFNSMATSLAVDADKATIRRQFAIAIAKTRDATERLDWSERSVVLAVCSLTFLVVVVAATLAAPPGRKVVSAGSVDKLPLAAAGAGVLIVAFCGWLLLRL